VDAERWKQIEELFRAALAEAPERRVEFIEQACPDTALRGELQSLLQAAGDERSLLESMPFSFWGPGVTEAVDPGQNASSMIGPYRLLEKIGEGGMGEVWLAEQGEPVRRQVALKLVKAGRNTREVIARFESERQAMALMDHPAIAKVFDAGSTPEGTPYFVMEYVSGMPITAYCDKHRFSTLERLELFLHVCEGVQHAHQKAIIHRDLKPSNILVTEVGGQAVPKIIDFGVAKALTRKLTAETMYTRLGMLIGTPEYMSPEQADGLGQDIDTRTDVYSLGIVFYELLAGAPPLELRQVTFEEYLRRLREEEPAKPSTRIHTLDAAASTEIAHRRQSEPVALARMLRGDLDSIALKALEKERSRRYGSPSDMAADIRRYLRYEAVLAVPPSVGYRARKFARRHRGALATVAAFAVVLILAAAISIWQIIRATRQRQRADAEAAAARAVNDFLRNDLLSQASASAQARSSGNADPDLKVRTALERAASRVAGRFNRQPEVEAAIRDTIGDAYLDLRLGSQARPQLERALELHRRVLGPNDRKTLMTMSRVAWAIILEEKPEDAEKMLKQALEMQRRVLGPEDLDTLNSMAELTGLYLEESKYAEAEEIEANLVDIRRRVQGPEHRDTLASMHGLAFFRQLQGKSDAETLLRKTLELQQRVLGPADPDTIDTLNDLAYLYENHDNMAEAEALERQVLEMRRRVFGSDSTVTAVSVMYLGRMLNSEGKYAEAELMFAENLRICQRALGPEHPQTLNGMHWLAAVYAREKKYAQAERLYRQTLEIKRRVAGPESFDTLISLGGMAFMYRKWGKYALAESASAQALAIVRHTNSAEEAPMFWELELAAAYNLDKKFVQCGTLARDAFGFYRRKYPHAWARFHAESLVGTCLAGQMKYAEAEPLLLESYSGMASQINKKNLSQESDLDDVRRWIIQLHRASGKPDQATQWRNK